MAAPRDERKVGLVRVTTRADSVRRGPRVLVAGDGHRVTPFELFFDLVFVFAITQVTAHVAHTHTVLSVVQAAVLLGLLWWAWSSYTWLGNQAHADIGAVRLGMIIAMIAVFVVALAMPEAWHDEPGGLHAATVLAVAYILIRLVHEGLYVLAAAGDTALRHQLALNLLPLAAAATLLLIGTRVDEQLQTAVWGAALLIDWLLTYLTSMRGRGWRINSIAHWVERHGLVVILALGESIVAIGVGASGIPLDWELVLGACLGIVVATALWWLYFDVSAGAAEQAMQRLDEEGRVRAAIESYTYLHYWMVLGVVLTAVGIEDVLAHATERTDLGGFAAGCLCLGAALYLTGHVLSWLRLERVLKAQRVAATAALLLLWPVTAGSPPLVALAAVSVALLALVAYENIRYAEARVELQGTH